jgi:hypothetical protein
LEWFRRIGDVGREGEGDEAAGVQGVQGVGPRCERGEGDAEGVADGDADGLAVEGVAAARGEEDGGAGRGQRGDGAEDAADVVGVGEVFEDDGSGGVAEQFRGIGGWQSASEGEHTAVHVEADDAVEDGLRSEVDGGIDGEVFEGVAEGLEAMLGEEDRFGGETRADEFTNDQGALGDEGTRAAKVAVLEAGVAGEGVAVARVVE